MDDLEAKRVHTATAGASHLLVATGIGLVVVAVAETRVGSVSVARRGSTRDVAVTPEPEEGRRLAVATDEDVFVAPEPDVDALVPSNHGPAVAVTFDRDDVIAVSPDGALAGYDGAAWEPIETLEAPPTALDGDLAGTADGVSRLVDGTLHPAGLQYVTDIARADGVPLVATAAGLFMLGNGWMDVLAGDITLVAGAPDGRAHAATADTFFERVDDEWRTVDLPVDGRLVAVTYGERTYVFTADGTLLIDSDDGWATHVLGLDDVRAAALL